MQLLRNIKTACVLVLMALVLGGTSSVGQAAQPGGAVACTAVNTDKGVVSVCGEPLPAGTSLTQVASAAWTKAGTTSAVPPDATCGVIQNAVSPSISGTPQPGNTLHASPGTWTDTCYNIISFGFGWSNGYGGPDYPVSAGDVGQTLYVTVTACDTEGNCASAGSGGVTIQPNPSPPPPPPPVGVNISASPQNVAFGGTTTVSWSSSNASSCLATGGSDGWYGNGGTMGSWTSGPIYAQTTYTMTCSGNGQSASNSVTVTVAGSPLPSVTLSASPNPIAWGGSVTLSWSSANSTGCTAPWTSQSGVSGSQLIGPVTAQTTYTITCGGAGGNNSASVLVSVTGGPPPTVTLSATPSSISLGGSATLSWSSSNASSCSASWTASNATSGQQLVSPTVTTSYRITCTGAGGSATSGSVTVTVLGPPTVSLIASAATIAGGTSATLSWSSSNASSCSASWTASTATSGSQVVSPAVTTSYAVTCKGAGGSTTSSPVTITVLDAQALPPYADGSFSTDAGSRTLSGGTPCRNAHVIYTYKNLVTGYVYFRWELSETFCWKHFVVTQVINQSAYSIEAHYPWNYEGLLTSPSPSGVGSYNAYTFAQGKYQACAAFGIGCLKSVAPYARIIAHGDGTTSFQYGLG